MNYQQDYIMLYIIIYSVPHEKAKTSCAIVCIVDQWGNNHLRVSDQDPQFVLRESESRSRELVWLHFSMQNAKSNTVDSERLPHLLNDNTDDRSVRAFDHPLIFASTGTMW